MSKNIVKVEIEDSLDEIVNDAWDELALLFREALSEHSEEYKDCDVAPDLDYMNLSDKLNEIADCAVPVYTSEIRGLWFLYENYFIEAYERHGIGSNPKENDGMTAIYCYIYDALCGKWNLYADDVFLAWYGETFGMTPEEYQDKEE